ncbi:MAG: Sec-independent protein translocase protein TatB [Dongiaceae bacterium]
MFDIGWSEMMIIGVVALVVLGPKELPGALKTFAYWTKQARKLAREFQSGVDDMIRQSELDVARKAVEDAKRSINREIENSIDPTGDLKKTVTETDKSLKSALAPTPSSAAKPTVPVADSRAATPTQDTPSIAPAQPSEPEVAASADSENRAVNG